MNSYNKNWPYAQMPLYGQSYICPMNPGYLCPFYNNVRLDNSNDLYVEDDEN
jgi:hypothetical protein